MSKDYYKILGVSRDASEEDIKRAYRKAAHQHHPDKQSGDADKFKEVNEAYQVLSNKEKRAAYDRFGEAGVRGAGARAGGNPFGAGFEGFDFGGFSGGGGFDFNNADIFETFFGGGAARKPNRGADLKQAVQISLEDAFRGVSLNLSYSAKINCTDCSGSGSKKGTHKKTCAHCGGSGVVREQSRAFFINIAQNKICNVCSGAGQVPENPCDKCKGHGFVSGKREIEAKIPPGIHSGDSIRYSGFGEAGISGTPAGDLYILVQVKPHKIFQRDGDDLIVRAEMSVKDMLLGRPLLVPLIDGGTMSAEIPAGFNLRDPLVVSGKGMPKGRGRGDLLVELIVKAPKKAGGRLKEVLENE